MKPGFWLVPASVLLFLAFLAVGAPFLSPNPPNEQFRDQYFAPPSRLRFSDPEGGRWWPPLVYRYERVDLAPTYRVGEEALEIRFFVEASPYRWMGRTWTTRLVGLEDPDFRLFLLGSDALGRDQFSRIVHGARVSLSIGLLGALLTLAAGLVVGLAAGYVGGWVDRLSMRLCDLFLSFPALFVVLGVRALLPLRLEGASLYATMILVFSLVGWPWVARVVRGQVLSLREREYVLAAKAAGASPWRVLRRHVMPFTGSIVMVQGTVLIPAYMVAEVTLSFLGLGVQEPQASWGNLLAASASVRAMADFPWMLAPAFFLFAAVLSFNLLGDELKVQGRQKRQWW